MSRVAPTYTATMPMAKVETLSSALEARKATRSTAAVRRASSVAARSTRRRR
jgi:hypothetical protein